MVLLNCNLVQKHYFWFKSVSCWRRHVDKWIDNVDKRSFSTLSSSLTDASKQLSLVSVTNKNAKLVSNPVSTKETDNDSVKVNGIGMAPYMIAVSLMVVALSTNVIFASSLSGRPVKNRFEWAKQKFFINGLISTVGSLVLYGAIQFLGFKGQL